MVRMDEAHLISGDPFFLKITRASAWNDYGMGDACAGRVSGGHRYTLHQD